MKKNLFLTIIISYATLVSININAFDLGPGYELHGDYEHQHPDKAVVLDKCYNSSYFYDRRYLKPSSLKEACDRYVTTSACNWGLLAGSLGCLTGATYICYSNSDISTTQKYLALAGTATFSGLAYWARKKYLESKHLADNPELKALVDINNDFVFTSDESLGFSTKDIENRLYDDEPDPFEKRSADRKAMLLELFNNRDCGSIQDNWNGILNRYHAEWYQAGPSNNPRFAKTKAAMNRAKEKFKELAYLRSQLDIVFKDIKKMDTLYSIIKDAGFEHTINSNLSSCDYSVYWSMQNWLKFMKKEVIPNISKK